MKINSKISCILIALLIATIIISASSAANLINNDFKNEHFAINTPSGSNFSQSATTDVNVGDIAMNMLVFENSGNNSNDVGTIIYLKDSSSNKNVVSKFINDLKKDGEIVEENNNFTVLKTKGSNDFSFFNFDVGDNFNNFINDTDDIISSIGDINLSADGNNFSLSNKGFKITGADGESVSITGDGIKVSGTDSNGSPVDANVNFDGNLTNSIPDGDYVVYLKNHDGNQLILIGGNNLELLKSMAGTASFK